MNRGVLCCLVAALVLAGVPAGVATPDSAYGMPQEFDPDTVSLSANVQENGSATWTFTYRMRLTDDNETAAFESLQSDIQNNSSAYTDRFRERISATVAAAANETGRDMTVSNVDVSTRVNTFNDENLGVVTYSFTWSKFADVEDDRLVAGDALEGFYLDNETSLRISWPESHGLVDVDPDASRPNENAVEWPGPKEFSSGEPRVVVSPNVDDENDPNDGDTQAPGEPDGSDGDSNVSGLLIPAAVGAVAAAVVIGGAGWYYREQYGGELPPTVGSSSDDGVGNGASDDGTSDGGVSDGANDATTSTAAGATAGAAESEDDDEPPAELLSNEERVKRFLREEGGRAKQQALVQAMDWTEAKTSQVVKQMREDDEVESFRIGRENVLKLPDDE